MKPFALTFIALLAPLAADAIPPSYAAPDAQVYLTNGIKIGDVSDTTAVLWTRTCTVPHGNDTPHATKHPQHPEQCLPPANIKQIAPADRPADVPGRAAFVRFTLIPAKSPAAKPIISDWLATNPDDDFCIKYAAAGLLPDTDYLISVDAVATREQATTAAATSSTYVKDRPLTHTRGSFRTAPDKAKRASITATVTSCQYFWDHDDEVRGFKIYDSMARLNPDFIVQQGDYIYYDRKGIFTTSVPMARAHWHAQNTWPSITEFYRAHAAYFTKDDHDTLFDDANAHRDFTNECATFTFADGVKIWKEQTPTTPTQYRTFRWGKDFQFWLIEGRELRTTTNEAPDGPQKSLLGTEQKSWLERTLQESDATFKVIFSPTAIVGPDFTEGKDDNYSNASWTYEGDQIRTLLAHHGAYVVNGDRHWQYHSIDPKTGLREFSKGPASNQHTIGRVWDPKDFRAMHQYLRVNGGFLSLRVERVDDEPRITFSFYDVDGNLNYSRTFDASGKLLDVFFSSTPDAGTAR